MEIQNETEQKSWEKWLKDAMGYEKASAGRDGKPSRFNPSIQYNLVSMALEGYVMAMTGYHGKLPENHTYTDLVRAWESVYPLDPDLKSVILRYEDIQSLCSLSEYHRRDPEAKELDELRAAVEKIGQITRKALLKE